MAAEAHAPELATTRRILLRPPVAAWALYDFANTIFSYAVITRYFNEWIIVERDEPDYYVGLMGFVVALALVAALPPVGAIADRYGARKPFLVAFTLACVALTATLGLVGTTLGALAVAGAAVRERVVRLLAPPPPLPAAAPVAALGCAGLLLLVPPVLLLLPAL